MPSTDLRKAGVGSTLSCPVSKPIHLHFDAAVRTVTYKFTKYYLQFKVLVFLT